MSSFRPPPPSSLRPNFHTLPQPPTPRPHHAAIPLPCHLTAFRRPCTQKPIVYAGRRQKAPEREMEPRNEPNSVSLICIHSYSRLETLLYSTVLLEWPFKNRRGPFLFLSGCSSWIWKGRFSGWSSHQTLAAERSFVTSGQSLIPQIVKAFNWDFSLWGQGTRGPTWLSKLQPLWSE